jgi:CRISPR-associated endonuclease/helicase Cas3
MLKWIERMLRRLRQGPQERKLEPPSARADNAAHGLATDDRALAQPSARGTLAPAPGPDSEERRREHGLRGRTRGPGGDGSGTRAPRGATRYIQTRLGILSYTQLAPHLARNVLALEKRIEDGEFERVALDDALLLRFHSLICGDLVPQLAGWRRTNVAVGEHEPPQFFQVPALAREYGLNLQARLAAAGDDAGELLLETLAFAEGRLLSIHPFADFNGRVARVWLREVLRRLDLPPVQLAPSEGPSRAEYLSALRAADRNNWRPLMEIWRRRFEDV